MAGGMPPKEHENLAEQKPADPDAERIFEEESEEESVSEHGTSSATSEDKDSEDEEAEIDVGETTSAVSKVSNRSSPSVLSEFKLASVCKHVLYGDDGARLLLRNTTVRAKNGFQRRRVDLRLVSLKWWRYNKKFNERLCRQPFIMQEWCGSELHWRVEAEKNIFEIWSNFFSLFLLPLVIIPLTPVLTLRGE